MSNVVQTPTDPLAVTTAVDIPEIPVTAYPRKSDGSVDWRAVAMRNPGHFYVKREHESKVAALLGKQPGEIANLSPEDIAKVPDKYLVIRKAGILELARLRGYSTVVPEVKHVQPDYVVVQTHITWEPFEGQPGKTTGGVGEAHPRNTSKMGGLYLAATAENRSVSRCVRQFLEIDIVCSDELGDGVEPEQNASSDSSNPSSSPMDLSPQGILSRSAQEGQFTFSFEQVKNAALSRWNEDTTNLAANPQVKRRIENDPSKWTTWADIPPRDCYTLTQLIQAAKLARSKGAQKPVEPPATTPAPMAVTQAPAASRKPAKTKILPSEKAA